VTQSTSGGGNADKENTAIEAAVIVQYASNIGYAVQKLRILDCTLADVRLRLTNFSGSMSSSHNGLSKFGH
jgi:hypothetical protein